MPVLSPYQQHVQKWSNCQRCTLCKTRRNVVLARGKLPADILFIGEAPGRSEDVLGYPFAGPAGQLLDQIILRALVQAGKPDLRTAFTNLVACIPLDDGGTKTGEPLPEDVRACSPRLQEMVRIADPKLLVLVGQCTAGYTEPGKKAAVKFHRPIPRLEIVHPAAILRASTAQQSFMVQKCVVQIRKAAEGIPG